jgi:hypothetical protein
MNTNATCRPTLPNWIRIGGTIFIALLLAGCNLGPPTPEAFQLPTPSFTPTIDPHDYTATPVIYPTSADNGPAPKQNCTFPAEYWKDHPQDWQFAVITVGGKTYTKQDALVFFNTRPMDTFIFIYEQVFTMANNILNGADSQVIGQIQVQMNHWLDEHPIDQPISKAEQNIGIDLARQIEMYNLGFTGPGLCAGAKVVATEDFFYVPVYVVGTASPTPTGTPTSRSPVGGNQAYTPRPPTATPKPTRKPGGHGGGSKPTKPPDTATHAPPTKTKAPPTPIPPTKRPTKVPTPTSPPLAPPAPTKLPNPTPGSGSPAPTTGP